MFNIVNQLAPDADVLKEQVVDVALRHPPQGVLLAQHTGGSCRDVLKHNAMDVARIPTDKVPIASVHPGIGEEEHEELHGWSWVFHHNVPECESSSTITSASTSQVECLPPKAGWEPPSRIHHRGKTLLLCSPPQQYHGLPCRARPLWS